MNDESTSDLDPVITRSAAQQLDSSDEELMHEVSELLALVDPVPDQLVGRVQFALALDEVFDEVARITRMPADALATRGDAPGETMTSTLSFTADRLTAMVTLSRPVANRVRVDGWLAPAMPTRVRLRMEAETLEAVADESGRFSFDSVAEGFGQLSFHPVEDESQSVVTPVFQL